MCCLIPGDPVQSNDGKYKTYEGNQKFQVDMMSAPCAECPYTCCWFMGQFIPVTCGITQCMLRRKILNYDMTKYSCFQGQFDACCCISSGSCGEESCPDCCLFCESCCCNSLALSASRNYVMEKYDLTSDPCDYRLIRINNCLQCLACICDILAIIDGNFRECARILDWIANLFFHCISGCMTAQVSYEQDYQNSRDGPTVSLATAQIVQGEGQSSAMKY